VTNKKRYDLIWNAVIQKHRNEKKNVRLKISMNCNPIVIKNTDKISNECLNATQKYMGI
jgi:hypothetical protein